MSNSNIVVPEGTAAWAILLTSPSQVPTVVPVVPQPDANGHFATPADGAKFMASMGIPQTPLRGKIPFLKEWQKKATTDPAQIDAWYAEYNCNFGSVMKAEAGGFFALETDSPKPRAEFKAATQSDFAARLIIKSGPGRAHWYYAHDAVSLVELSNIVQTDADGFSLRLNNEQCVSPGSVHPERMTQYAVLKTGSAPMPASSAEIAWLKSKKVESNRKPKAAQIVEGKKVLIPHGEMYGPLISQAGKLWNNGFPPDQIPDMLVAWAHENCEPEIDEDKVRSYARGSNWKQGNPAEGLIYIGDRLAGTNPAHQPSQEQLAQKRAAAKERVDEFFYDPAEDVAPRVWIHRGFNALKSKVIWVGTEKAEKSLFALRKAMHEACGKDWLNFPSNGPIVVAYFDAENPTEDIDDRYDALMDEFTAEEQVLIRKNLKLFKGREYKEKNEGMSFDVTNTEFWTAYADSSKAQGVRSHYLDCLYQFHSLEANKNEGLKAVIEKLHIYLGLDTAFTMLHHTHKESDENLGKPAKTALRYIGARAWSNKIYGGGHIKKMADVIVCQERFEERDGSVVLEHYIDLAVFSRIAPDSVLMSFEDDVEERYLRHLVVALSMQSQAVLDELKAKGGGPWASRFEASKILSVTKRKAYERLNDLISKGYLIETPNGGLVLRSGAGQVAKEADLKAAAEMTEETSRSAKKWLKEFLGDTAVPVDVIKAAAKTKGIEWRTLRTNRKRYGVVSEERGGIIRWRNSR